MKEKMFEGELIEKRVIIWEKDSLYLYDEKGFGKPQPEDKPKRLELDLVEATYLLEKGKLKIYVKENGRKKYVDLSFMFEYGAKEMLDFHSAYVVYKDLRERGYLVKSGFKFGTIFRVYGRGVKLKRGPKAPHEHTKWIVHPVAEEAAFSLPEMARAVRLAHNIRATMLWAVVDRENGVTYYQITRITP